MRESVVVGFPSKVEQFFEYKKDEKSPEWMTINDILEYVFNRNKTPNVTKNFDGDDKELSRVIFRELTKVYSNIRIWVKTRSGKNVIIKYPFRPYLYVRRDYLDENDLPYGVVALLEENGVQRVVRKDIETMEDTVFYKLTLRNTIKFNYVRKRLREEGFDVREDKVFFEQRFMVDSGIPTDRWVAFYVDRDTAKKEGLYTSVWGIVEKDDNGYIKPKFKVLSDEEVRERGLPTRPAFRYFAFDIEVYNKYGMLPEKAPIIAIGYAVIDEVSPNEYRYNVKVIAVDETKDIEKMEEQEVELLREFTKAIRRYDPDVIVGHNSSQFDIPFILRRMEILNEKLGREVLKPVWGRLYDRPFVRIEKTAGEEESSFINMKFKDWELSGRVIADTLFIAKRDIPGLNTYNLKDILETLKIRKKSERVIIKGHKLWQFWETDREKVLEYLKDDVEDTVKLWEYFLPLEFAISKFIRRPLKDAVNLTTSNIVEALMLNKAFERGLVMPKKVYTKGGYAGAFVHEPNIGVNEKIFVVDFKSLYPTTIITRNISPETYVGEMKPDEVEEKFGLKFEDDFDVFAFVKYMHSRGYAFIADYNQKLVDKIMKFHIALRNRGLLDEKYDEGMRNTNTRNWFVNFVTKELTDVETPHYAVDVISGFDKSKGHPNFLPALERFIIYRLNPEGFAPSVIKEVLFKRFELKKKMKEEVDEVKKKEYDFQQNSLKKIVNSAYGYFGYTGAMMFRPHVAESITAGGRMTILHTIKTAEKFGFVSVYGDSVAGDSRVTARDKEGRVYTTTIEELFAMGTPVKDGLSGKEYVFFDGEVETLSLNQRDGRLEWKPIKYVMRHKTDKRMYRIKAGNVHVDVTEDHSLIVHRDGSIIEVKPLDVRRDRDSIILLKADKLVYTSKFDVTAIKSGGYVYDIEVEGNHNFFANGVLVHNTDSEFIQLGEELSSIVKRWEQGDVTNPMREFKVIEEKVARMLQERVEKIRRTIESSEVDVDSVVNEVEIGRKSET